MFGLDIGQIVQAVESALPKSQVRPSGPASYSIDDFFSSINRNVQPTAYQPSTGGMTYEQLMQGVNEKAPMSIDDILSGIQSQFGNQSQYAATPYETGAQRFVSDVAPSAEYFVPAEFDAQKYKMDYESAQSKLQSQLEAQGYSKPQAQSIASTLTNNLGSIGGGIVGSALGKSLGAEYLGTLFGGPAGAIVGGMLGSQLGSSLNQPIKDIGNAVGDVVGGGFSAVADVLGF
jgi:outer membrane lipoprotein SlyB